MKLNSLFGSGRSSSLPPERRRTLPPRIETTTNVFNETVREGHGSARGSGSGSSTPTGSFRGVLSNFMSPRVRPDSPRDRLDSPQREEFDKLDRESKQACQGLSKDDLLKYLCLSDDEQQLFNDHTPEDRKTFLLLNDLERKECSTWRNEENRSLYMKLTPEEKVSYREYEELLKGKHKSLSKCRELLKNFMEISQEERKALTKKGERLANIRSALNIAKEWDMTREERAKTFCSNRYLVGHLNEYLEGCEKDAEALQDLGGFMVRANLISVNNFQTVDDLQTWIKNKTTEKE